MERDYTLLRNREEVLKKLYEMPVKFMEQIREKDFPGAKKTYDSCVSVSVFMELPEEDMMKLFGSRAYTDDEQQKAGLFHEELVQKAYLECIRTGRTYENEQFT